MFALSTLSVTVGVLILYTCPVVKPVGISFPPLSCILVPLDLRSSLIVPSPDTLITVTFIVVPFDAETDDIEPCAVPVFVSVKSEISSPVTFSLKVTLKIMLVALVVSDKGVYLFTLMTYGNIESTFIPVVGSTPFIVFVVSFPAISLMVPLLKSQPFTAMLSVSTPVGITYLNTNADVPLPLK